TELVAQGAQHRDHLPRRNRDRRMVAALAGGGLGKSGKKTRNDVGGGCRGHERGGTVVAGMLAAGPQAVSRFSEGSRLILFCSFISASSSASGRGGQPLT